MRLAFLLLTTWLLGPGATAQVGARLSDLRVEARYDVIEQAALAQRVQAALRVEGRVGLGRFEAVAFASSGDDFASRWATLYRWDRRGDFAGERPRVRRLYVEYAHARYRAQAGAIPPVKATVSPTGLDPAGWIDGVRVEWYMPSGGTLEGVGGRLGEIETPSVFERPFLFALPRRANYAELELSQPLGGAWLAEVSAEYLGAFYARGEVRWAAASTEVFVEMLYNTRTDARIVAATVEQDALAPFGRPGLIEATVRAAYKHPQIGLRGELAEDFVTFGQSLTAALDVALSQRYGLTGQVEAIVAEGRGVEALRGDAYTRFTFRLGWRLPR